MQRSKVVIGNRHMRRRDFIGVIIGSGVAWPFPSQAQQADQVRRISALQAFDAIDPQQQGRMLSFLQGLQGLGWIEGRTFRIDYRWAGTDPERIRSLAVELVRRNPDVILAGGTEVLRLLQQEIRTIPIVFTQVADPVGDGLVASLEQPGGNMTGLTAAPLPPRAGRWLELLTSVAPRIVRVTIMLNPERATHMVMRRAIEEASRSVNVRLATAEVRTAADIGPAIEASAREPNGGLIVLPGPITTIHRTQIIALAAKHRVPAIYAYRFNVVSGGLMSCGADPEDQYREAASYVDRILRGAKPGDLPIQQPTKFELVINLKTAKALGLDLPPELRRQASQVIE